MPYENFNVNTKTKADKTKFARFYGTFQTKFKALSLSRTKDFCKDDLNQVVAVLQSFERTFTIALENKWENNRVFLDVRPVTLQTYYTTFSLKVSWL